MGPPSTSAHPQRAKMLTHLCRFLSAALLLQVLVHGTADARMMSKAEMQAKQSAAAQRFAVQASSARGSGTGVKNITFSNPRASGASAMHPHL